MARLRVRVTPRAGRDEIAGMDPDGVLRVRVTAAPERGEANSAAAALIAARLGLPRAAVRIVAGAASRRKVVECAGIDEAAALAALRGGPPPRRRS